MAESYPALFGKITEPIRQDRVSTVRGPIGLHSVAEIYPQLADQLLPNLAESYPALFGKITEPIRQDRVKFETPVFFHRRISLRIFYQLTIYLHVNLLNKRRLKYVRICQFVYF